VLVLIAVLLHLVLNLGALRERLGRLLLALLPTLAIGLAWLPVALWQSSGPSGAVVYMRPVSRDYLASLDVWSLEGAAAFTGATRRCTWVYLVFAGVGAALLFARSRWRAREAGARGAEVEAGQRTDASRLGLAALLLLVAGLIGLLIGALWPMDAITKLAASAVHQGQPLDAGGLEFVARLRKLALLGGAALVVLAASARALPAIARRIPRDGVDLLLPLAILLPLIGVTIVDSAGVVTFLPRHSIYAAAPLAVLVGGAIAAASGPSRMLFLCGVLVAGSARGFRGDRPLRDYPDFRSVGNFVNAQRDVLPVAHPDWSARCVEYYAGRRWDEVAGVDDPAQARRFAGSHPRFLFVVSYEGFEDPRPIRAAFEESHHVTLVRELHGVRLETWEKKGP
jgi:hypothetical protein